MNGKEYLESEIRFLESLYKKKNLGITRNNTQYMVYVIDGKKYVNSKVYKCFIDVLKNTECLEYDGIMYYLITHEDIKRIKQIYSSFPKEIVFPKKNIIFDIDNTTNIKEEGKNSYNKK